MKFVMKEQRDELGECGVVRKSKEESKANINLN
jgi:hypothetical protein